MFSAGCPRVPGTLGRSGPNFLNSFTISMKKSQVAGVSVILLLAGLSAWQAMRIQELTAANAGLTAKSKVSSQAPRLQAGPLDGRRGKEEPGKTVAENDQTPGQANPEDAERAARDARGQEFRKLERTQRIEARILALKTKLNLTPQQEVAVRQAMEKGSADRDALREAGMERRRSGQPEDDAARQVEMAKFKAAEAAQEEAITSIMSEDQLAAYGDYKAEQKATEVESRANQQLNDLQNKMALSDDQKDAAFQFYAQMEQTGFDPGEIAAQGGDVRKAFEERQAVMLQGMEQILSPEQYQLYSTQEKQRSELFNSNNGGGPPGFGGGPPGGFRGGR